MTYAGEVVDGQTIRAIVGTAEWAEQNLGGEWHNSESKIPVPGTWDEIYGFRPEQPGPDCWWENDQWVCPEPPPEPEPLTD
jgi:hypothetical protein